MVPNFSIPLTGFQQPAWDLDTKATQRIASQGQEGRSAEENASGALGLDPAADINLMAQVENTAETNLRVLSTHDDVNKNMLDLLA